MARLGREMSILCTEEENTICSITTTRSLEGVPAPQAQELGVADITESQNPSLFGV